MRAGILLVLFHALGWGAVHPDSVLFIDDPAALRASLLQEEDTDGDHRITVLDPPEPGTGRGDRVFGPEVANPPWEVRGTYRLSVLLEELSLLAEQGRGPGSLHWSRLLEKPADRLERSIRERLWDGLTRCMDERGLPGMLRDEKVQTAGDTAFLYVPGSDTAAQKFYRGILARHTEWSAMLVSLPNRLDISTVPGFEGRHGLLALGLDPASGRPRPFVVPGGRFNEMYGWDSYFIVAGLVIDGRWELARSMIDNLVYEIRHYGKILNANRTYYLTRSQPPFLTSMLGAVLPGLPRGEATRSWVVDVISAAITEYRAVWTGALRLTRTGLSRYCGEGRGVPPEVEPGHYEPVFAAEARRAGMDPEDLERRYRSGTCASAALDAFFVHDRAMRESGHDTSYRLYGRCADLVTVDLNCLLYRYELDIARLLGDYAGGVIVHPDGRRESSSEWSERAARRKALVDSLLWDEGAGLFFDFDVQRGERTRYLSATTLYPLWAGMLSPPRAERLIRQALPLLEMPGGIVGSTAEARGPISPERPARQWDYPFGWSPHQMLVWEGLARYGFQQEARRLAYRWLYTIAVNAASYQGTVPEKFDVVARTHQVFAEYGNVGTTFSYITREGFGWTNASVLVGLSILTSRQRDLLNDLVPPEAVEEW